MSLIQEALRRQNEDGDEPSAGPPPESAAPAPKPVHKLGLKHPTAEHHDDLPPADLPPGMPEEAEADSGHDRKRVVLLVSIIGVILVLACAGGGAWYYLSNKAATSVAEVKADADLKAALETKQTSPVPTEAPVTTVEAANEAASPVSPTEEPPAEASTVPPPIDTMVADATPVEDVSIWPSLTLSGTGGHGPKSLAFINKQLVHMGDIVEGAKVLSIDIDSVELEFNGERQIIKVGGTTK